MPDTEVFEVQPAQKIALQKAEPPAPASTFDKLLTLALEKNVGGAELEKIVALAERMADRNAKQEYIDALREFQEECPKLPKVKTVDVTKDGRRNYSYNFAPLPHILRIIRPYLSKHGFCVSWDTATHDGKIKVTCKVQHIAGHEGKSDFEAPISGQAPGMSQVQATASVITYGKRQSLLTALGLDTEDIDNDGTDDPDARIRNANGASDEPPITDDMLQDIANRCQELGRTKEQLGPYLRDVHRIGNGKVQDLRKGQYDDVVRVLQDQLAKRAKGVK